MKRERSGAGSPRRQRLESVNSRVTMRHSSSLWLQKLAEGAPGAWLTREAKAALARVARRSGSPP